MGHLNATYVQNRTLATSEDIIDTMTSVMVGLWESGAQICGDAVLPPDEFK